MVFKKDHPAYNNTIKFREKMRIRMTGKSNPRYGKGPTKGSFKKGHYTKPEWAKASSIANLGKKLSEETKRKMSLSRKGLNTWTKGKHWKLSEEAKKKISLRTKGRILSQEHKNKISYSERGKKLSEETKRKIGDAHRGEKSYLWQGGISFEPYSLDWTETLKRSIRERDEYICYLCKNYGHQVHHIDYDKKNCNPINLITLCKKCHPKTNKNRNKWIEYFKNESIKRG